MNRKYNFGVETLRVGNGREVNLVCVDCGDGIEGTVALSQIEEIINNTASRGGVKCPECRALSCACCGVRTRDKYFAIWADGSRERKEARSGLICWLCIELLRDLGRLDFLNEKSMVSIPGTIPIETYEARPVYPQCPRCESNVTLRQLKHRPHKTMCVECDAVWDTDRLIIPF